ncbi:MAG TPA: glycoside hydrolase family 2 TIM barrel-domain containing protein, partial [Tepidisphaeraceae bacterium]|nr:glycoside hydrolase family 2 TIM barrel-domain containing protein [Tepidisphaeraceae bacterium]
MSTAPSVDLQWTVGFSRDASAVPESFVAATVPGAVQLDWARAHGWGPYWYAENYKQYDWMEDVFWTYRATLRVPPHAPGERIVFVCGGVDYRFDVLVDGEVLLAQEGMFTPVEIDLTGRARDGSVLAVRIHPIPKRPGAARDRNEASASVKPAVSYGWDFHPRLVPSGIWQDARLEVRPATHVVRADVTYTMAEDLSWARLAVRAEVVGPHHGARWELFDPAGKSVAAAYWSGGRQPEAVDVARPELWWPHDHGGQPLYRIVVEPLDAFGEPISGGGTSRHLGFRRARLVMHEGAWDRPDSFPKGRSNPPITLEINGRRIFAKGSNWVGPDIFPGTLDAKAYEAQLSLVRQSNMNLLRMWGGAPVQKEAFYEHCDTLGIMVWQEFTLACNNYPDDAAYLRVLDQESRSVIRRLRQHPSVVLWCGGNELFNGWSGMTDQSHALRLLNGNCFELDRHTPFLPTSPVMGMGHGHYTFLDVTRNEEAWSLFQGASCTAYTEFGMASPASVDVLREIIPPEQLWPPRPGAAWEAHHAFRVWMQDSHLYPDVIEHYFGPAASLDQLVADGQLLQGEGYKGLFEEARRQKPVSAMALNWCLNEPWPTAANNSL